MYRKHRAFLSALAIVSLTATAASQWCWAQGIPVRLTNSFLYGDGDYLALSPDGTKIAFVTQDEDAGANHEAIYVMNADGTDPVRLKRGRLWDNFANLRWSPDGTKIAFLYEEYIPDPLDGTLGDKTFGIDVSAIYVMNADGTDPVRLKRGRLWWENFADLRWSPDGTKIAFVYEEAGANHEAIYVMNADGTDPVQLTSGSYDCCAAWSPDGTKIVFGRDEADSSRYRYEGIYAMNADGTDPVQLTSNSSGVSNSSSVDPVWSPDGTKIVFWVNGSPYGIYVVNADGTDPVRLTGTGSHPAWSPDGTKIAFTDRIYQEGIYVINADGTDPVRLTSGYESDPAWSPDGTKIFFMSSDHNIYVIPYEPAHLSPTPTEHGDTRERARAVGPDSTTPGALEQRGDVDYFRVDVTQAGRLTVETTGETDTFGVFQSAQGQSLAEDDDAGTETNFRIARDVSPGTYYVEVTGYNRTATGDYTLRIAFTPAEDPGNTERGDRRATLLNLSPWQAWVHLYCLKDQGPADPPASCTVTFECNGQSGEPVTWPVEVGPKTIFSYWPNKTTTDGTAADLQAALVAAGKTEDEARRRTTCEVFSPDPLTVRGYTLFGGQPTLVPIAEPARPAVTAEPGERRRQATLPNLSPWQAWVHLYCLKDRAGPDADPPAPCAVTFECNGQSGDPVTWPVEVAPKTIFSYWPNKTVDGRSANLQAALIAAGKPEEEARRRTTCEVSSADPIAVRGYTLFGGQPTLVPVPAYPLFR